MQLNPYGIIIVHNHPSGDPSPSDSDKKFTYNLLIHTTSLGLDFCDHIIIGHGNYFSFAELGIMQDLRYKAQKNIDANYDD